MVLVPFRKQNSFNNSRKDSKFGINLVDSMLNTLQTLELANVYLLPHENITISSATEAQILFNNLCMRPLCNVMQCLEFVKQGLNPICVKFHIFPKISKEVSFPERRKYHFSQF